MLRLQQRTIADASPVATDLARGQAVVASDLFMCDEERGRYHQEAIALDPILRKATSVVSANTGSADRKLDRCLQPSP